MKKEDVEKKLEELEIIIENAYVNQMVVVGKSITNANYNRIKNLIKDIYWFLDGLEES